MIRKVKARFDRNPRRSNKKIASELNVSRERSNTTQFQKVQELTDGQKKLD